MIDLFAKYDVPAPRYTSYPTVPFWSETPTTGQWLEQLHTACADQATAWSLYLHLPFCESLCTFCACNTVITRDHRREANYIELLMKEWGIYVAQVPALRERPLRQLHLGGGTPTFFSAENLQRMLSRFWPTRKYRQNQFEASLEVDPRHTTREQLPHCARWFHAHFTRGAGFRSRSTKTRQSRTALRNHQINH